MSIYRKFDREPSSDVHAKPVRRDEAAGSGTPAPKSNAAPATEVTPLTAEWAAKLPPDVRPRVLLRAFPRIANAIAAVWTEPETCRPYVDELFVDRRGNRNGFPPDAMEELFALRAYYEELHPTTDRRWDGTKKRS
jgi:hypothetical protein